MITVAKSVYVDTNVFVYARAAENFPSSHAGLQYYQTAHQCTDILARCREHALVVYTSMISHIELYALYLDWHAKRRLVDRGFPIGFCFGGWPRSDIDRQYMRDLFLPTERTTILQEITDWFTNWNFKDVVTWRKPYDIPNWEELTEIALRYSPRGQTMDALHIGAAIGLECNKFFTTDKELRSIISKMRQDRELRRELKVRGLIDKGYGLPDIVKDEAGLIS